MTKRELEVALLDLAGFVLLSLDSKQSPSWVLSNVGHDLHILSNAFFEKLDDGSSPRTSGYFDRWLDRQDEKEN